MRQASTIITNKAMGNFTSGTSSLEELEPAQKHINFPQNRQDLELYAKQVLERACSDITHQCKAYLDIRESKVNELESKIQYYERTLNKVKHEKEIIISRQTEGFNEYVKKTEEELQKEKDKNAKKSKEIEKLKKLIKERDEEILKLKSLTDPAQAMRRKGHCIRPGDVLHEHVSSDYKALYSNRNLFRPLGITNTSDRIPELTKLLQLAYDCSKVRVIECAKQELEKLFEMPQKIYSVDEKRQNKIYQPWQSRQEALSLLLSLREEKLTTVPCHLVDEVTECYGSTIDELKRAKISEMKHVIEEVSHFAWKMVTLSPPVSFGTPTHLPLTDDIYDITDRNNQLKNGPEHYRVEYRRPVLFFGPLGTVGEKGSAAINPLIKDSNDTPQDEQSTPIKENTFEKCDSTSHTKQDNHCTTTIKGEQVHGTLSCDGDLQTEKDNESDAGNKESTGEDTNVMEPKASSNSTETPSVKEGATATFSSTIKTNEESRSIDSNHDMTMNNLNGAESKADDSKEQTLSDGAENKHAGKKKKKRGGKKRKKNKNKTDHNTQDSDGESTNEEDNESSNDPGID